MFKRLKSALALTLVLTLIVPEIFQAADIPDKSQFLRRQQGLRASAGADHSLANEFIQAVIDDDGFFTVGTIRGVVSRATDDNQDLLFAHPSPGTSNTFISIDGVEQTIHGSGSVTMNADSLVYEKTISNIAVEQRLSFVTSGTGNADAVQFYYKLTNTSGASHNVGLRVQLDTLLGSNDGAPFRIADVGPVTTDREFLGVNIPIETLVLDNLLNPNIIAATTFRYQNYRVPDRVVLGYWPASVGGYDYTIVPGRDFTSDSSVVIYWGDPSTIALAAGQSLELAFSYGVSDCSQAQSAAVSLLVCAPSSMTGQISGATYDYFPNPFTLTAFVSNLTGLPLSPLDMTLHHTADIELLTPGEEFQQLSVDANATAQIDWALTANGRYTGIRQIVVKAVGAGAVAKAVTSLIVLAIPNALYGIATDTNGSPIAGATITAYFAGTLVGTATSQSDGRYAMGGLAPGTYQLRMSAPGRADTFAEGRVVASSSEAGFTANPIDFAAQAPKGFIYPSPVREDRAFISFYAASAGSGTCKIFDAAGHLIEEISIQALGTGWNVANWDTSKIVNGTYLFFIDIPGSSTKGKVSVLKRQ